MGFFSVLETPEPAHIQHAAWEAGRLPGRPFDAKAHFTDHVNLVSSAFHPAPPRFCSFLQFYHGAGGLLPAHISANLLSEHRHEYVLYSLPAWEEEKALGLCCMVRQGINTGDFQTLPVANFSTFCSALPVFTIEHCEYKKTPVWHGCLSC